jgi:proline iminopeptidase
MQNLKIKRTAFIFLLISFVICIAEGCAASAPTKTPVPTPLEMEGLKSVNGTELYYQVVGKGSPLFVLHAIGQSHGYFLPYLETLADDHQLVFYDQRGTGLSDGHLDISAISIAQFVEDLEALRVALGFEKISLMGHSWGAVTAMAYAIKYQAHLDHLILVDSVFVDNKFADDFSKTYQQRFQHLSADDQKELKTTCSRSFTKLSPEERDKCNLLDVQIRFYDPAKASRVDWPMEENTIKNVDTVSSLMRTSFQKIQSNFDTQLSIIQVPTLIIHGDFDPIPLASSEYLHEQISGSQIVVIAKSGHFPFIEQPEQFTAVVRSFLLK